MGLILIGALTQVHCAYMCRYVYMHSFVNVYAYIGFYMKVYVCGRACPFLFQSLGSRQRTHLGPRDIAAYISLYANVYVWICEPLFVSITGEQAAESFRSQRLGD